MSLKRSVSILIYIIIAFSLCLTASAADEISQSGDRLNYYSTSLSHTVTVSNTGTEGINLTVTCPADISFSSGSGCLSASATTISCAINPSSTASYTVTDSGSSMAEYATSTCYVNSINNSYTSQNNVSFLRIKEQELFHTLVEYGRGRGNYFYDTFGAGTAGSDHTGSGCNYVPDDTMFELNFLHKILNVKQWFGDLTADAYNATFDCTYPNRTIVRQHLISSIITNSSGAYLSYLIPKIEGSWERMGYLSMNFDANEQYVGELLYINCTNMAYSLPIAGGYLVVDDGSFALEVRDKEPFIASAATTATIGNGTQEVLITYTITNNEVYSVDDVIIEIEAPQYAAFIGTRAELWGTALNKYRFEKTQMVAGESEIIQLIARFDTSSAPSIVGVNLTDGINIKYITCWEANAYNPGEYMQTLTNIGSGTVNMAASSTIIDLINSLQSIDDVTQTINSTVLSINSTVQNIEYMTTIIESTTNETNAIVKLINSTLTSVLNDTATLLNNTQTILTDTNLIAEQLDCDGTNDSPICDRVRELNTTLTTIWNLTQDLKYLSENLNVSIGDLNVTGVNVTVNIDWTPVENLLYDIELFLNCTSTSTQANESICNRLEDMETTTAIINSTIQSIESTTLYFNQSIFGNLTFQDIIDSINNVNVDTDDVLSELQNLRQFDEELVFLVTDSFGLQQQARSSFDSGNLNSATSDLMDANLKLNQAVDRIVGLKSTLQEKEKELTSAKTAKSTATLWKIILMTLILAIIIAYLVGKPSKKQVKK